MGLNENDEKTNETRIVVIDGIEYVPKSALEEMKRSNDERIVCLDRFTVKQEGILHKLFVKSGYGFNDVPDCISEKEAAENDFGVMDSANVCMIIGKTLRAKLFLRRYVSIEQTKSKIPNLDYSKNEYEGKDIRSKYGVESLQGILNFFNKNPENHGAVYLKMKRDFPLTIEDEDFRFIIAPRVDND